MQKHISDGPVSPSISANTIPQRGFGYFWGPHGFWPLLKISAELF